MENINTELLLTALREQKNGAKYVEQATAARDACIRAKALLSSQSYGSKLEAWIKNYFNLGSKIDNLSGDASLNNKNFEIKVSVQGQNGSFNYVQIRPFHNIDAYIILNYSIDLDEVIWLYIPHVEMPALINEWGTYAHGTLKQNGPITMDSILNNKYEYAIRPNMHKEDKHKAKKCWNVLEQYKVTENELRQILHKT
jgi:hypothetical protein